MGIIY
jgi:hypothetical protein